MEDQSHLVDDLKGAIAASAGRLGFPVSPPEAILTGGWDDRVQRFEGGKVEVEAGRASVVRG